MRLIKWGSVCTKVLIVLFFIICSKLTAQQADSTKIFSANIIDSTSNDPLNDVDIFVFNDQLNKVILHKVTDEKGNISIPIHISIIPFIVFSIQKIGYEKKTVPLAYSSNVDLGRITLKKIPGSTLADVLVSSHKDIIQFSGNEMSFDPAAIPNIKYLTTADLMGLLPFIQIIPEENEIQLMGSPLKILINGREHPFYNNLTNLKNLPPQAIERIDVKLIGTAQHSSKVMNIILKKNYFLGWNGSLNASGDINHGNGGGSFSYWSNKFGFDFNSNYNIANTKKNGITEMQSLGKLNTQTIKSQNKTQAGSISISGFYKLDSLNALDFSWSYTPPFRTRNTSYADVAFDDLSQMPPQQGYTQNINFNNNNSFNLNYTKDFKKAAKQLLILTKFSRSNSNLQNLFAQSQQHIIGFIQDSKGLNTASEATGELFYKNSLGKKLLYTAGTKLIDRKYSNRTDVHDTVSNIVLSNFEQVVSSSFVDGEVTTGKWVLHGGGRFDYQLDKYVRPIKYQNKYYTFIPNASVTYNVNKNNLLIFSYTRNVSRPDFSYMVPVGINKNSFLKDSGNAYLKPQYQSNYGLQYYGNLKRFRLGFNLEYDRMKNWIDYGYYIPDDDGSITNTSLNVKNYQTYTLGFSVDFSISKKIRFSHFASGSINVLKGSGVNRNILSGYLNDRISYNINAKQGLYISAHGYTANVNLQGKEWSYLKSAITYARYLDLFKAKYPAQISISVAQPYMRKLFNYTRQNSLDYYYFTKTQFTNPFISLGFNISLKGKSNKDRTFNQSRRVENYDIKSSN